MRNRRRFSASDRVGRVTSDKRGGRPLRCCRTPIFTTECAADHPRRAADQPLRAADHPRRGADHPLRAADHPRRAADHPLPTTYGPLRAGSARNTPASGPITGRSRFAPARRIKRKCVRITAAGREIGAVPDVVGRVS